MSFSGDMAKFAKNTKADIDKKVRGITLELFSSVIMASPVGNPELWASNKVAVNYNAQVAEHNSSLRNNPDNLDKRGRLKRGRKLNDGMDVKAPKGYVGGRFRGNWQTSIGAPVQTAIDRIDPTGAQPIADAERMIPHKAGSVVYMSNNLPYAERLEFGWSKQAPAGMVRINVARIAELGGTL